ncbi:hypothetical protein ENUP19_0082G0085 [Entamoeba nuttalli]|uniref:Uncharacterized protein n=2 Tax=Entamoeba nuttalli TaxID=412467 RepID=K2H346_ENTNP|nr:hypothetical protein ENU1_039480 [Entamoeba nuttalli P19]EKE41933.1 hypothetical protein ENU1_039480 [Entamoeba nuttalli P19]|eukprot:XP_008855734.1 hypothetical protein ENU1_039480 [Entamoeba nuttalli P19]
MDITITKAKRTKSWTERMKTKDKTVLGEILNLIIRGEKDIDKIVVKCNVLEWSYIHIELWKDNELELILSITSSLIVDDVFKEYLAQCSFIKCVNYLMKKTNEEIKQRVVMILNLCLVNDTFRKKCIESNIQKIIVHSFKRESTHFYYQNVSYFCKLYLLKKEYLSDNQINDIRRFYIHAICSKSTPIILDGLNCFYYFATTMFFTLSPTTEFLHRLSELVHHKNSSLSRLASNFASFYQIE